MDSRKHTRKRNVTILSMMIGLSIISGCDKKPESDSFVDPQLLGPYNCTAAPQERKYADLLKLDPSFLFLRDGSVEYTVHNGNLPAVTWIGTYRIDENNLYANYKESKIGNMSADPDEVSYRYKITQISAGGFSIEQIYGSQSKGILWSMTCNRG